MPPSQSARPRVGGTAAESTDTTGTVPEVRRGNPARRGRARSGLPSPAMRFSPHQVTTVADGLDHPEGVAIGRDGTIHAGGERGQMYRITGGVAAQYAATGGFVLGLALDATGVAYVCDVGRGAVLVVAPDGTASVHATGTPNGPFSYPNYPVFDATGNLFVTDSGRYDRVDGRVVVIRPDGQAEDLTPPLLHYPNGLALHEEWLYVAESTAAAVIRFPVLPGPRLGPAELYAHLPGTVPDGLAFGSSGTLYVGCYRPDAIYAVSPGRVVTVLASDPMGDRLNLPTNLALTAAGDLIFANLGGYHLGMLPVDDPAAPLHYPG